MTASANEIRERLSLYLSGQLPPAEFRDWFVPVLRDAQDPEAEALAHSIEWEFLDLERHTLDLERGISGPRQVRENLLRLAASETNSTVVYGQPIVLGDASYVVVNNSTGLTYTGLPSWSRQTVSLFPSTDAA